MQKKSLDSSPDETQTFEKGKIDLVNFEGALSISTLQTALSVPSVPSN